jgi:UDP-N-acetylglucosamine 2-epimerase (non-hydrolysing)
MRVLVVFGTRPEAIKMAPVVKKLAEHSSTIDLKVCVTAQHRTMLDQVLELFDIQPDVDLDVMRERQDLTSLTCSILTAMQPVLRQLKPQRVLVHGDTTTSTATALASFYERIPVGHVEAGLRTGNIHAPWPEEMNRLITARIADQHFAPTETSRSNLLREGIDTERIHVTGNTVIDALQETHRRLQSDEQLRRGCEDRFSFLGKTRRLVLVTGHRRENFGSGFEAICRALKRIVVENPDVELLYPVHLNPNVQEPVRRILGKDAERVHLIEPVDYLPFVYLMGRSEIIITDSGGVQEEAPSLGKPVLVMRDTTERPEAVAAGTVRLVGAKEEAIVAEANRLLRDAAAYQVMSRAHNPYGDGRAAARIADAILEEARR